MSNDAGKTIIPRALLAVVTLGVLVVLAGLAYASPPDASWIPGIYDNADLDDVVVLVTTASGVVGPGDLAGLRVLPPPTATAALPPEKTPVSACPAPLHARAPPLA
jgi:Na+-transporting NADH:ubiquinone oxidoreductase subunit NqrD